MTPPATARLLRPDSESKVAGGSAADAAGDPRPGRWASRRGLAAPAQALAAPAQALAARTAEVVFTAQNNLPDAQEFYAALKAQHGRAPHALKIMPGFMPVIGRTEAEARALFAELSSKLDMVQANTVLSDRLGMDMSGFDLDAPVPELPESEHLKSRARLLLETAWREGLTLRELCHRVAASRGHLTVIGTPAKVADTMEQWFRAGGADGFNLMPPFFPGQFDAFVDHVVPILQERGLFRREYEGRTLGENLGLTRPASRYAGAMQRAAE